MVKGSDEALWHIRQCDGYIDLKMLDKARSELGKIDHRYRQTHPYKAVEMHLAMEDKNWQEVFRLASELLERYTRHADLHIKLAYAARRTQGLEAARKILLNAQKRFPKIAVIPFNLACYECQLGHPDEAMVLLDRAFRLDASFHEQALEDEDLKPIWDRLGQ